MLKVAGALVGIGTFLVSQQSFSSEMSKEELFQYVKGEYQVVAGPTVPGQKPDEQALRLKGKKVTVEMEDGEIFFRNALSVDPHGTSSTYKVTEFHCRPHWTCEFQLQLIKMGDFIHFLGNTPSVEVDNSRLLGFKLIIDPIIYRAEVPYRRLPKTVLTRTN